MLFSGEKQDFFGMGISERVWVALIIQLPPWKVATDWSYGKTETKMMQYPIGNTDALNIQVQDSNGLGYEHVAFPFLALLFGLCVAFMQLGTETAITCKKGHSGNEEIESM